MKKYLLAFFILGVIFRLWIGNLIPQPFIFDQTEYHNFAIQILQKGLVSWQPRLYGYPLFLSVIYLIFGIGNLGAVAVIQSILDCLTAVLVYLIAKELFKDRRIGAIAFTLYILNPFTSVFVVLTLTEILSVFLVVFIAYLIFIFIRQKKIRMLLLLGFLLGYLPQVRPTFLFWSFSILILTVIKCMKTKNMPQKILTTLIMLVIYFLPFVYNIAGNWVYFQQFSPTTVDNLFVREFYISLYVTGRSPFHALKPDVFPKEVQMLYNEYTPVPQSASERKAMANKYLNLGVKKIVNNPGEFIFTRIAKFWYVWEKHFLFYYTQPENKLADFLTYWGNNLLLFMGVLGFGLWSKTKHDKKHSWFTFFVVFTVSYISIVHSFSLAEERYSLPGYPLIFLFAGYGIFIILNKFKLVK